jgi:hypothetical protein
MERYPAADQRLAKVPAMYPVAVVRHGASVLIPSYLRSSVFENLAYLLQRLNASRLYGMVVHIAKFQHKKLRPDAS